MMRVTAGNLVLELEWRPGATRPYLAVRSSTMPIAMETTVCRQEIRVLAAALQRASELGLRDAFTDSPRIIPEETAR